MNRRHIFSAALLSALLVGAALLVAAVLLAATALPTGAQRPRAALPSSPVAAAAQGGADAADAQTFANPAPWADLPDPDVIRVGRDFYLVTTTMHLMPGAPVMRSRDLRSWQTVSFLFDELHETPRYDLREGTVYGRGQWATSIRYVEATKTFWALFSPNDEPYRAFIYKTTDPSRGWTLHARTPHFHDASLFFDDDGRVYVFSATGRLQELRADMTGLKEGGLDLTLPVRTADETGLLEGSRVIKKDGRYYLLMISWPSGRPRREVCYRASSLEGPWEKRVILESQFGGFPYAGQGTIVDDAEGRWWGVIFQDRGAVGRVLTVEPCRWEDGWPMLGDADGRIPERVPVIGEGGEGPLIAGSDEFDGHGVTPRTPATAHLALDPVWQWNHNPDSAAWSLDTRRGVLRLATGRVVPNLFLAPNTLTQRMRGPRCSGEIAVDFSHMRDGDRAGFAAFNGHACALTLRREGRRTFLTLEEHVVSLSQKTKAVTADAVREVARVELPGKRVRLRIEADFTPEGHDTARFSYALGRKGAFAGLGDAYHMRFDFSRLFMGTRFAIFNFATQASGGHIDVDYFRTAADEQ